MKIINIILYLCFSVGGLVLVKMQSNGFKISSENGDLNMSINIKMILGLILYIISFLIYTFYIVKKFDLSYIFPIITGITQILVILAGIFIFKEQINIYGYIGMAAIIIGVILLNIK